MECSQCGEMLILDMYEPYDNDTWIYYFDCENCGNKESHIEECKGEF